MSWIEKAVEETKLGSQLNQNVAPEVTPTKPTVVAPKMSKPKFEFVEETDAGKEIYTFFGLKGSGKTTAALSLPGKILALSFDGKTSIIKNNIYANDDRIKIFDAMKYYDAEDPVNSSVVSYDYIIALLEKIGQDFKPDYVLFDCAEELTTMCEMVMRQRSNITAYGGISNQNVWKLRRALLEKVHDTALRISSKGIVYTLYIDKNEIVYEGTLVEKSDVPKWTGVVLYATDFVLKTKVMQNKDRGKICTVEVVSSKNDKKLKTGTIIDVTDFKNKLF